MLVALAFFLFSPYLGVNAKSTASGPAINSLSPTSGSSGAYVTINGKNFTSASNTVIFGSTAIYNLISNGTQINFTVPTTVNGKYTVQVQNLRGTSNTATFTVTNPLPPSISSISPTSGRSGTSVTLMGAGFTASNNTVYFGTTSFSTASDLNGTRIIFTAPSVQNGIYNVMVSNVNGSSNSVAFTLSNPSLVPVISSLNPSSGSVSASVTIKGSGFLTSASNTVVFGPVQISNVASSDGNTLVFAVPSQPAGLYYVGVSNVNGGSNVVPFTILSSSSSAPTISSLNPSSGPAYTNVIISGSGFTLSGNNNTIHFGSASFGGLNSADGSTLSFTVPPNETGTFNVTVSNANGSSNAVPFTIPNLPPSPTITSASPSSGPVGTSITIKGSYFTYNRNVLNFGSVIHDATVISSDGNTIVYTVPSSIAIGTYNITVATDSGTSNPVSFTVTGTISAPAISSLNPSSGASGSQFTINGSGFAGGLGNTQNSPYNTINFGSVQIQNVISSDTTTLSGIVPQLPLGTYNVSVTNANGTSNAVPYTITSAAPSISSLNPSSGPVSTNVTMKGSWFTSTGNTVAFGPVNIPNLRAYRKISCLIFG